MSLIKAILQKALELEASDIHLKVAEQPFFRVHGDLIESGFPRLSAAELNAVIADILPEHIQKQSAARQEIDFSYQQEGVGRFRVNIFLAHNTPCIALRYVKTSIPSPADLHLPPLLVKLAAAPSGIVLVAGATNSGKSTTLAAMLQYINQSRRCRIITLEDPVEYLFKDIKALISQREVGLDTPSFHTALKYIMRQDPDVIMIGETRDHVSMAAALGAAATGHLVLTTLHANTAVQAIQCMLGFFPPEEREQVRLALAANLVAILCQRLIPGLGGGVLPAVEILLNTPTVHKLLLVNKIEPLQAAIETGQEDGMQSFNQAIYKLIKSAKIASQTGLDHSPNPESLKMNLQGIFLDQDHRILGQ